MLRSHLLGGIFRSRTEKQLFFAAGEPCAQSIGPDLSSVLSSGGMRELAKVLTPHVEVTAEWKMPSHVGFYLPLFSELKVSGVKPLPASNSQQNLGPVPSAETAKLKDIFLHSSTVATAEKKSYRLNSSGILKTLRISRVPAPDSFSWSDESLLLFLLVSDFIPLPQQRVAIFSRSSELRNVLKRRTCSSSTIASTSSWLPQAAGVSSEFISQLSRTFSLGVRVFGPSDLVSGDFSSHTEQFDYLLWFDEYNRIYENVLMAVRKQGTLIVFHRRVLDCFVSRIQNSP